MKNRLLLRETPCGASSIATTLLVLGILIGGSGTAGARWRIDPTDILPNPEKPWEPPPILRPPGANLIPPEVRKHANVCAQIQEIGKVAGQFRKGFFDAITRLPIPNDGILLFDHKTSGSFTYNAYAGAAGYKLTLPGGIELDKSRIKATFEGSVSVPTIKMQELISELGFIKLQPVNGYEDWANKKKESQNRHVFVSSKRFVDAISDNKVLQEIGWAVLTGGSTTQGSIQTLKEQLILEWADVLAWLERVGEQNGAESAREIVEEILKFAKPLPDKNFQFDPAEVLRPPKLKSLDLELKFHQIPYDYVVSPPFASELKKILSLLHIDGRTFLEKKVRETHLGYSISIKKSAPPNPAQQMKSLVELMNKGPQANVLAFAEKVSGGELNFKDSSIMDVNGNKKIQDAFQKIFADQTDVEDKGDGVFDFRKTKGAKQLEEKLKDLAIGNEAKGAKLNHLLVDVVSATITLDLDLYHRYRLTKGEILDALNAALKINDLPFDHAKDACKAVAKICKNDLAKATARDVCDLVKPVEDLPPVPTNVQVILAGTSDSNAQANVEASGPYANDIHTIGMQLPVWCFIRRQRYTFEITMDHVVRGLAVKFSGSARRNKNGSLSFSASKPVDFGPWDSETLTEEVSGTVAPNGDLIVEDYDKVQFRGACRSVD